MVGKAVGVCARGCTSLSTGSRRSNSHNFSSETVHVKPPPRGGVTHHAVGLLRAGFGASRWATAVGVPVTQAAAFHHKIVDGVMSRGEGGGAGLLRLTRTRLTLQETHPQVGDHQLVLGSHSERVHLVGGRQRSVDHLEMVSK